MRVATEPVDGDDALLDVEDLRAASMAGSADWGTFEGRKGTERINPLEVARAEEHGEDPFPPLEQHLLDRVGRRPDRERVADIAHPPDRARVAEFDHGHLEHFFDDADPVARDDVVSVVDPGRGDEVRGGEPAFDFFAGEDALDLDFRLEVDDLTQLAAGGGCC